MAEASVFDHARAHRALKGVLPPGDGVEAVAVDDATRFYWVVTTSELIVLDGDRISSRVALTGLSGDLTSGTGGTTLTVRDAASGNVLIGTFRSANKVTRHLAPRLQPPTTDGD